MLSLAFGAAALLSSLANSQDLVSTDLGTYGRNDPKGSPFQTFQSSLAKPPELQINSNRTGTAPGYIFIAVGGEPTSLQKSPVIVDVGAERMGTAVWAGNYTDVFDFRTQTYQGEPVLTFWAGASFNGYGRGSFYILNTSYVEIAKFDAPGFPNFGDLHEFTITENDTAMVLIYAPKIADLTPVGGSGEGWIFDSIVQEVDIATGDLLFQWNSTTHVPLNESYNALLDHGAETSPYDYFHVNAAEKDADGNYLVSGRVMDCVYKINGTDGSIIWRMGGKLNDFDIAGDAVFSLQHDARWIDDRAQNRMTLFDNGPTANVSYSRGLLLDVNQEAKTVRLIRDFTNPQRTFGQFQGSLQAIDPGNADTNFIIGYGSEPYFAEFDNDGNVLLDVQFGITNAVSSYRTYKAPWTGQPLTPPDMVYDSDGRRVYLSWNGATNVETWGIYTADSTGNASAWSSVVNVTRSGFETTIDLTNEQVQAYVIGQAFDGDGASLAWSRAGDGRSLVDASTPEPPASATTSGTAAAPSETKKAAASKSMNSSVALYAVLLACIMILHS